MAVRLDKNLRATIDKVVASYNRKITKYKKLGYTTPSKVSYQDIIKLPSRKSILNELKNLNELSVKNIDTIIYKGHKTSIYEKESIEKKLLKSKRLLKSRIKNQIKTDYKLYGKNAGFTMGDRVNFLNLYDNLEKGQIRGDKLISNLRKLQRIENIKLEDYYEMNKNEKESFMNLITRIENPFINKKLKENYLEALSDLGSSYGYDSKKLAEIEKKLKQLTNEDFEKMFTEDLGIRRILSYYDILKINIGSNNIKDNKEAIFDLYDNIYDNINQIVSSYKS